jgi:peptide/nickel transport system permease protein
MSTVQLTYATLSFLGLGLPPPHADFGSMLLAGAPLFTTDPWLVIFPAVALVAFIVMLNGVGDCVRELLEPAYTPASTARATAGLFRGANVKGARVTAE